MARTKKEIKKELTTAFMTNGVLADKYGFTIDAVFEDIFSLVSMENIWFEIVAFSYYTLEVLFDVHKKEVDEKLANQKSGRLPWYKTMALQFQYGFDLVPDEDYFDNGTATEEEIAASKIVKYAAVGEPDAGVVIKIAGENAGILSPIATEQLEAFTAYMEEVRWAGVDITVVNFLPDRLELIIQIEYDALVLDKNGMSILNGDYPVNNALNEYMKELPFDGQLTLAHLTDKLQRVPGVKIPTILSAKSSWIDAQSV